jgi:hypothetical protein
MSICISLKEDRKRGDLTLLKAKSNDSQYSLIPVLVLERGKTEATLFKSINEAGRALNIGLTAEYVWDIRPKIRDEGFCAAIISGREYVFYRSPYYPR